MGNYAIAGAAALGLLALAASSSSPAAGTESMYFFDYMWVTLLPTTSTFASHGPGDPAIAGASPPGIGTTLPPPPGQQAGSGQWHEFAAGYDHASNASGQDIYIPIVPNIPPGISAFVWRSTVGVLTQINGYNVINSGSWKFQTPETASGVLPFPRPPTETDAGNPPPPPGQSSSSGNWTSAGDPVMLVWVTPSTTNTGLLGSVQYSDPALAAAVQANPALAAAVLQSMGLVP